MATITYISEKTQSKTAMGKVMRYCVRKDKTACTVVDRKFQLISGKDCCGETAFKEFMATKQQYGKANGMFFYQYVQSFSPDENITPEQAHEVGCKFAEYFKGHEVLIATHTDAKHIHTHLIINSVNFENGKKLQMSRGSIYNLRDFSDEICRQHNLSIVIPKETTSKNLRTREYRAALKGESWKFKLINAVDNAMAHSKNKVGFIANMQKMGYGVNWSDNRKHITYTTPDGKKCRDNKMHDDKYLKHNMEVYYEYGTVKSTQQAGKSDRGLQYKNTDVCNSARNIGTAIDDAVGNSTGVSADAKGSVTASELAEHTKNAVSDIESIGQQLHRKSGKSGETAYINDGEQDGQLEIDGLQGHNEATGEYGESLDRSGFIPTKATPDVDGLGSIGVDDIIRIAHHIENIVNPYDTEKQRQQAQKPKKVKRQRKSQDWDMEM